MDKKATDKLISVYWFAILILTAAAIVYMVSIFYSQPYDIRELEAGILANKIADCVSQGGKLDSNLIDNQGKFNQNFSDNLLNICKINFNAENTNNWKDDQYYFSLDFFKVDDSTISIFNIKKGNLNLASSCEIQKTKEYSKLAKCVEKRFYAVGNDQYLIKILSVVRKTEKNVKQS